ncbi:MAG: C40 family peptidase [Methylobacter sp.]
MTITAQTIIEAARSQLGVKFQHQGRCPGLALDCAGLGAYVAQAIGAEYNEWPGYGRSPHQGLLESVLDNQPCLEIVLDRQPGDLLLMRFGREPQHVAIFTGDTIIHSYEPVGMVCEHGLDAVWESRIVRIYRFNLSTHQ